MSCSCSAANSIAISRSGGCPAGYGGPRYDDRGGPRLPDPAYDDSYRDDGDRYENGYDPSRYYRSGGTYQERVLSPEDRVYAGTDGRYYCKRSDGTTGLIVGGAAGGLLGNVIDGGHSRVVGTLLGGAAGRAGGPCGRTQQQRRALPLGGDQRCSTASSVTPS